MLFRWEAYTRCGASDQFNEPSQTKGQEFYGQPAWIDNNTLMVTDVGSLFRRPSRHLHHRWRRQFLDPVVLGPR